MTPHAIGPLYVDAVGLVGPGLPDWAAAREVLSGARPWQPARTTLPRPSMLPPAERRRAGRVLQLAVAVAAQAAGETAAGLATVFTSSGGDGDNSHQLCETLATPERAVSPTRFMNSVHNAPAGYWSIAAGATAPSTALCAFDGSFAAGLLEAAAQIAADEAPVLLVAYDADYPEPLRASRPIPDAFGCALRLAARRSAASLASLRVRLVRDAPTCLEAPALETLRRAIPAARALPLLRWLATRGTGDCVLEYLDDLALHVEVTPC